LNFLSISTVPSANRNDQIHADKRSVVTVGLRVDKIVRRCQGRCDWFAGCVNNNCVAPQPESFADQNRFSVSGSITNSERQSAKKT
jgi:hypothetical protein